VNAGAASRATPTRLPGNQIFVVDASDDGGLQEHPSIGGAFVGAKLANKIASTQFSLNISVTAPGGVAITVSEITRAVRRIRRNAPR